MTVRRIVANLAASDPGRAHAFYEEILGLEVVMDHGWIQTFASRGSAMPQISVASEGGSGTPVPDLSIEVDDVDEIYRRAVAAGFEITYHITDEPWGVRRFYVRDPFGRTVNILSHAKYANDRPARSGRWRADAVAPSALLLRLPAEPEDIRTPSPARQRSDPGLAQPRQPV